MTKRGNGRVRNVFSEICRGIRVDGIQPLVLNKKLHIGTGAGNGHAGVTGAIIGEPKAKPGSRD
jgi:hypothetical protein